MSSDPEVRDDESDPAVAKLTWDDVPDKPVRGQCTVAAAVPSALLTVECEVVSTQTKTTWYGPRSIMVVKSEADGWKAWGTRPDGVSKGDRITLRARFRPGTRSAGFGFFERPKIMMISRTS